MPQRDDGVQPGSAHRRVESEDDSHAHADPQRQQDAPRSDDRGHAGEARDQPGNEHPDADAEGYVTYPDVNIMEEMVDLMVASRTFDANVTVLNASKQMIMKSLEI